MEQVTKKPPHLVKVLMLKVVGQEILALPVDGILTLVQQVLLIQDQPQAKSDLTCFMKHQLLELIQHL